MTEHQLHVAVLRYLRLQHPKALVLHVPNEGKRTVWEQRQAKELGLESGWPDIMVLEKQRDGYHGLAIELKVRSPYRKDLHLKAGKTLERQEAKLQQLRERGWRAEFATGFEEAKFLIEEYMGEGRP